MKTSVNSSYKKSSFGPAFFFLSKRRREALAAYYEFCRLMDDIADEPTIKEPLKELDYWQEEVAHIFSGTARTALGKALTQVVREFDLPQERFLLLIEGMRADLQAKTYASMEELEWYLHRVAVVVGLATLDIVGIKGEAAENLARDLGRAVQLTNIIRDVWEDAGLGRVYLPEDLLANYQLSRQEVLERRAAEKVVPLLAQLGQMAQAYYRAALADMRPLPRFKMLPCRMMGCVYGKNLAKIRETGFLFDRSVKLTKAEKMIGVLHALIQSVFS